MALRRTLGAAALALGLGLGVAALLGGFSSSYPVRLVQQVALFVIGAGIVGAVLVWIALRLANWGDPESEAEFERVVRRSEALAVAGAQDAPVSGACDDDLRPWDLADPAGFEELVRDALDDLPPELRRALDHVAVVISDRGHQRRAYGLYHGDGVARDDHPDRIVIYRDTLMRDFGDDVHELRAQVTRTVRHELAHHLGWDEPGVRGLGL